MREVAADQVAIEEDVLVSEDAGAIQRIFFTRDHSVFPSAHALPIGCRFRPGLSVKDVRSDMSTREAALKRVEKRLKEAREEESVMARRLPQVHDLSSFFLKRPFV